MSAVEGTRSQPKARGPEVEKSDEKVLQHYLHRTINFKYYVKHTYNQYTSASVGHHDNNALKNTSLRLQIHIIFIFYYD